jgi:glycosyltransferase involved in cell wall biosynthesis
MFLLEAMAAARPFISTPVGSIAELASHGGVLCSPGSAEELAAALVRVLSDGDLATALGGTAREYAEQHRSVAFVDGTLRELYDSARASRR